MNIIFYNVTFVILLPCSYVGVAVAVEHSFHALHTLDMNPSNGYDLFVDALNGQQRLALSLLLLVFQS